MTSAALNKVIILGVLRAGDYPIEAPIEDPSYEVWCINASWEPNRWDAWFQLHGTGHMLDAHGKAYLRWLAHLPAQRGKRLYVFDRWADLFPGAFVFPHRTLVERYGDYFTGSFAWLIAFARFCGAKEIWLNSGNMESEAWAIPCIEYHLGRAVEAGITVHTDSKSGILDRRGGLYGYEPRRGGY